ncbi:MAG: LysM peptidoglycan-binding domain-containing protein [Elusimicrobiales bacterium]|nr:LysM peptidoglycan-binding domain-containing protein [Elusimicrobiales bacterium]
MNANASFSADSACGARASAMAGAFTAVPGGAEAACSNPATLTELGSPELTAVYGRLYSGLSDDSSIGQGYFGFAAPVRKYLQGNAAFSWSDTRLSEAYSESAYSLSYATSVWHGVGAGLTLKYLRRAYTSDAYTALDPVFSSGYSKGALGADLGFFYRPKTNYAFGLSFRNLNKPDLGLASSDPLPLETRAGFSYLTRATLLDVDAAFAGPDYNLSAGVEHLFQRRFLLRMGLATGNDSRRSVNLGFGSRFGLASFDYAFSLPISGIAGTIGSHRLAFSFKFGADAALAEDLAAAADLKRAQERAVLQEEKIRVLQERLDAVVRQSVGMPQQAAQPAAVPVQAAQPAQQPVVIIQPSQSDAKAQAEISRQIEILKTELEKSRAEMETLKARPAAAPQQAKPAQQTARRTYVVKDGDTLESIAASVYGDADRWPEIYRANSGSLGRGGEVKPGQVLSLP